MNLEKSRMEALEGISQAFFPDSSTWDKLKKALKEDKEKNFWQRLNGIIELNSK